MAEFDLTLKYCEYLDLHLTFPLFEILLGRETYDKTELVKFILETTTKTNVSDYSIQIRNRFQTGLDMIPELTQRKKQTLERLKELKQPLQPIITMAKSKINEIKDSKKLLSHLQEQLKCIDLGDIPDKFYELGKGSYDAGLYEDAAIELFFCLLWMSPTHKNYLNALWGKVAAETLSCNWSMALEDLIKLREFIDNHNFTNIEGLQQRAWWIHWSNMVFFNHPKGRDLIIEIFLYKPLYLNAIQTMCPHMLRYLATALIINRNRRNALKDLIKVIQQEANNYRDPITEFLECLYVNFDFDGARMKLHECGDVIVNDFFIFQYLDVFIENARLMIFETFCRIHQCITISMLAEKLNMDPAEAERWIVNLIRNARLDAKIDSKLGHVVMGTQPLSPYQQLVEKVDSLSVRSEHLTGLVERKHKAKNSDSISNWNYYN